tara:strand:+ start:168 stop:401 length:234 start_codon:yes stop_codon:yes gene_type:complete
MKKLILSVGVLGVMSFTTNQIMTTYELSEAINNVQDMKEWMTYDQDSGIIDSVYADYYIERLNETEDLLIEHFDKIN